MYRRIYSVQQSDCEMRHGRSEWIDDSKVKQISRSKWLVQSSDGDKEYLVKKQMTAEEEEKHLEWCHYCHCVQDCCSDGFCDKCDICHQFYSCDCPDNHKICKHIHKVHIMDKKLIENQGPLTLNKTILSDISKLQQLGTDIAYYGGEDQKEHFAEGLYELLNKMNKGEKLLL